MGFFAPAGGRVIAGADVIARGGGSPEAPSEAEGSSQDLGLEGFGHRAVEDDFALEQKHLVAQARQTRQIVGGNEHRRPFGGEFAEQACDERFARLVDSREGLIQEEEPGSLGDRTCDEHAFALASRQSPHRATAQIEEVNEFDGDVDGGPVLGLQPPGRTEASVPSHGDDVLHGDGEIPVDPFVLRCTRRATSGSSA